MTKQTQKTGTREWASHNITIISGCSHNCRYCYGKDMALRFGRIQTADEWSKPQLRVTEVSKRRRKINGTIMFQSASDITPEFIEHCLTVLEKLLVAGNQVLIVTKPSPTCVISLCNAFKEYREQIIFRFTIGSMHDDVLKFWEPGAPSFRERRYSIETAYASGYITSVSAEPYLDGDVGELYECLAPYVTGDFWIGTLRHMKKRVDMSGVTQQQKEQFIDPLLAAQTDEAVLDLYNRLNGKPLIKWKDSIKEVVKEYSN